MAFGLDDLANFVEGLRRTFKGSSEPTRVQQNIQRGVVDPLRMGAELSGVNQAYRGSRPDASNMDRGLALLAMSGYLSGGVANDIGGVGRRAVDTLNDFRPFSNNIYGVHMSPKSGLKSVDISKGLKEGTAIPNWYDNIDGANYFFNMDNVSKEKLRQMETYLNAFGRGKNSSMSAYLVRAPRRGAFTDVNDMYPGEENILQKLNYLFDEARENKGIALDGQMYTRQPLKVKKEIKLTQDGSRSISSKKLADAMLRFDSKNPNANKANKSMIEKWGKEVLKKEQQERADFLENFSKYMK